MPEITILIPTYNDGIVLGDCLRTVLGQTLKDIEVICVDDASFDNTSSILAHHAEQDRRLHIVKLKERSGAAIARMVGVQQATAPHIMFVDADDEIAANACETAKELISREGADVLQFTAEVVDAEGNFMDNKFNMNLQHEGSYNSKALLDACFVKHSLGTMLWNRIYETELVLSAFSKGKRVFIPAANDLYLSFLIAAQVRMLKAVITPPLYRYYYGRSFGDWHGSPIAHLERECGKAIVLTLIGEYMTEYGFNVDPRITQNIRNTMIGESIRAYRLLPASIREKYFHILTANWDIHTARFIADQVNGVH